MAKGKQTPVNNAVTLLTDEAASNNIRFENYIVIADKLGITIDDSNDVIAQIIERIDALKNELKYKDNYISELEDRVIKNKVATVKQTQPVVKETTSKMVKVKANNGADVYLTQEAFKNHGHLYKKID